MYKRWLSNWLVLIVLSFTLIACSDDVEETGKEEEGSDKTEEASKGFEQGKYDPPITIDAVSCSNTIQYADGDSLEDNVHTRWAEEELGIKINYIWETTQEECDTQYNLNMTAGSELPDVMMSFDPVFTSQLIDSGQMMDISDAYEKYASEQVKEYIGSVDGAFDKYTREDGVYGIPIPSSAMNNDPVLWLREDWMQELELEAPETLDDVDQIFDAFTAEKADFGMAMSYEISDWIADTSWVFGAYGDAIPKQWVENDEGELVWGSVQPSMKEGLAKLNSWFEKGYISSEFGVQEGNDAIKLITSGKAGMSASPFWAGTWPLSDVTQLDEDAHMKPYPIPAGPDGLKGRKGSSVTQGGMLVHKDFEHIDALFLYLNRLYEGADPEAGHEFEYGYAEGIDYVMKDGEVSYNDEDFEYGKKLLVSKYFLTTQPLIDPYLEVETLAKLHEGAEPTTPYEKRVAGQNDIRKEAASVLMSQEDISVVDKYQGPPTDTMETRWDVLQQMESEAYLAIIYGDKDLDYFDKFVEEWYANGGKEITEEVNNWYQEVQNATD
ncbi:extracellular solute-binding protein [Gracilibacillus kekensis]|uniref:Putative aldouronate transport system substrate-binding protein n=1 Tax=Gracilibacillus kekensis TaxID=1027249 RepID=A0A1M7QTK5_9BACI|nr:extracellular solute-binding protein [Gracilibacillus kekensis]SHN35077.1 putative aldouronate transport system substrate-binding protein [Gracilibacillus kekensis]